MTLITQEYLQVVFPKAKWDFDRLSLAVGEGLSLKNFIAHPSVREDEAICVAFNSKDIGVSFRVRHAILTCGIGRAVLELMGSSLSEVQDFYVNWVKNPPIIKREWDKPSEVFGDEVIRISHIAVLAGDWQSYTVLQLVYKAYQMYLSHETARGILMLLRFVYTCLPDGWITERNQQYKDLVRLVNEMGEGETA